jgi:diguanylate cyclase (GGDEF)-like protein/PAS domain S-box-containing protein
MSLNPFAWRQSSIRGDLRLWGIATISGIAIIGLCAMLANDWLSRHYARSESELSVTHRESLRILAIASALAARQIDLSMATQNKAIEQYLTPDPIFEQAEDAIAAMHRATIAEPALAQSVHQIDLQVGAIVANGARLNSAARELVKTMGRLETDELQAEQELQTVDTLVDGIRGEVSLAHARIRRRLLDHWAASDDQSMLLPTLRQLLQGDPAIILKAANELRDSIRSIKAQVAQIGNIQDTHALRDLTANFLLQEFARSRVSLSLLEAPRLQSWSPALERVAEVRQRLATLQTRVLGPESGIVAVKESLLTARDNFERDLRDSRERLRDLHMEASNLAELGERLRLQITERSRALGRGLQLGIALLVTLVVVVIMLLVTNLVRRISGPIDRLRTAMGDIASGALTTRLAEGGHEARNEISQLAEDFNRAASKTEELLEALAHSNARLEASEGHMRSVLNGVPDGIVTLSAEGRIVTNNTAAERIFAATPGGLVGLRIDDIIRPQEVDTPVSSVTAHLIDHFGSGCQAIGRRRDSAEFPVWVNASVFDPARTGTLIAVISDITAYWESEQQRRKNEALFQTLYENAPVMVAGFDGSGRCVLWNRELERVLGWTLEDVNRIPNFMRLLYPDSADRQRSNQHLKLHDGVYREASPTARNGRRCTHLWANFRLPDGLLVCTGYDITARKAIEERLQSTSTELDIILQNVLVGIAYVRDDRLLRVNRRLEDLLGCAHGSLTDAPLSALIAECETLSRLQADLPLALGRGASYDVEQRLVRRDGSSFWCAISVTPTYGQTGNQSTIWLFEDVTRRRETEDQLRRLASYDTLTQLPNRSYFIDRLESCIAAAERERRQVTVMFIDLDHFKDVNDSLGHRAGDDLLREVARRLTLCVGSPDVVARLGGDEFTLLLAQGQDDEDAAALGSRIIENLSRPYVLEGLEARISPSIGISRYPRDGREVGILLRNADAAMYDAKLAGRNTYRFYNEALHEAAHNRMALSGVLRKALEHGGFELHYQPQIDLSTGVVVGIEALLRLPHSEIGPLGPDVFIPAMEESGLIVPVGEWVLARALTEARPLIDLGICLAVNISGRQFSEAEFVNRLSALLRRTGVPPSLVELELTETVLMADTETAVQALDSLNALGVRLSVDDFGMGYSSLAYLKRFPLDTLKIDRSFIRDIPHDTDDAVIVEAILAMSRRLNLTVVAEGVETEAQRDFLRFHRCERVQGYLYARPMPMAEVMAWCEAANLRQPQNDELLPGSRASA